MKTVDKAIDATWGLGRFCIAIWLISEALNLFIPAKTNKDAQKVIDKSIKMKGVKPKFVSDEDQAGGGFDPKSGNISIDPKYGKDIFWGLFFKPVLDMNPNMRNNSLLLVCFPAELKV